MVCPLSKKASEMSSHVETQVLNITKTQSHIKHNVGGNQQKWHQPESVY